MILFVHAHREIESSFSLAFGFFAQRGEEAASHWSLLHECLRPVASSQRTRLRADRSSTTEKYHMRGGASQPRPSRFLPRLGAVPSVPHLSSTWPCRLPAARRRRHGS
jgi:hypothetical protein